jgi:hypothetical protein
MALTYLLFDYPLKSWTGLQEVAEDIDALLPDDGTSQRLADWLEPRLSTGRQLGASGLGTVFALPLAVWVTRAAHLSLISCVPYLVVIMLMSFLGANTLWWLWKGPPVARQLREFPLIPLNWVDPLATPGIAAIRRLLLQSARRTLVGAAVTLLPIGVFAGLLSASPSIVAVVLVGCAITFSTVLFISTFPQYWLSRIARERRDAILLDLRCVLADRDYHQPNPDLLAYLELYRWVSERPVRIWNLALVLQTAVAICGALGSCAGAVVALLQ